MADEPTSTWANWPPLWVYAALADARRSMTPVMLARRLGWRVGTVRALLVILENAGFAERDAFDRRRWFAGPGDPLETLAVYRGEKS